jgi:hypothetical protein
MARRIIMARHDAKQGDARQSQDDVTPPIAGPSVSRALRWHESVDEPQRATEQESGEDITRRDSRTIVRPHPAGEEEATCRLSTV